MNPTKDPFYGMIGLVHQRSFLLGCLERNTLAHAYLFVGPEGVGKTTLMEALACGLVGVDVPSMLKTHPNVVFLERLYDEKAEKKKTSIGVEQIREVVSQSTQSGWNGKRRVVLIPEAYLMGTAGANAFLKTLEEPRGDTVFLLRSPDVESLPATVVSRCQTLYCSLATEGQITEGLSKRGVPKEDAETLARQCGGRVGEALRALKDSAYAAEQSILWNQWKRLAQCSLSERIVILQDLLPKDDKEKNETAVRFLDVWEGGIREGLREHRLTAEHASMLARRIREARLSLRAHGQPHLALEHVVLYV